MTESNAAFAVRSRSPIMNATMLTTHPSRISCNRRSRSLNRVCMTSNSSYRISRSSRPASGAGTPGIYPPMKSNLGASDGKVVRESSTSKFLGRKFRGSLREVLGKQRGLDLVPPHPLGRVQRTVRFADQLLIVHAIGRAGGNPNADRQAAEGLDAAAAERVLLDQDPRALHRLNRLVFRGVDHDQPKLFPAIPRQYVAHPQMTPQQRRQLAEEGIAGQVAQRVVVVFEKIQVDHTQRAVAPVPADAVDFGAQDLLEMPPVIQPGQRIGNGQLGELGPQHLTLLPVPAQPLKYHAREDVNQNKHRGNRRLKGHRQRLSLPRQQRDRAQVRQGHQRAHRKQSGKPHQTGEENRRAEPGHQQDHPHRRRQIDIQREQGGGPGHGDVDKVRIPAGQPLIPAHADRQPQRGLDKDGRPKRPQGAGDRNRAEADVVEQARHGQGQHEPGAAHECASFLDLLLVDESHLPLSDGSDSKMCSIPFRLARLCLPAAGSRFLSRSTLLSWRGDPPRLPEPLPVLRDLTPMMQQYHQLKSRYPGMLLMFRLGDFYELFYDDALVAARELEITLTSREIGKGKRIPMCGMPYHAVATYLARLVERGHRVAVCDQLEDPRKAVGLVHRDVVRVVTPGTALEQSLLPRNANNYLVAAVPTGRVWGVAAADLSTGEFHVTELTGDDPDGRLVEELGRLAPRRIPAPQRDPGQLNDLTGAGARLTTLEDWRFDAATARQLLLTHFGVTTLDGFGCEHLPAAVGAAGALLHYLRETQRSPLAHIRRIVTYAADGALVVDGATRRNLELLRNLRDGGVEGTLVDILDETSTAMGARRLRQWLVQPLADRDQIEDRLGAVAYLGASSRGRSGGGTTRTTMGDLQRLVGRV